ncbi:hypothetical protein FRC02_011322 [Tulasnella sp. 418]|nr:hypothetical protein FRC02_011322 [Tulasnella sp. 418]
MSAFQGLRVSITDVIKGILDSYPAGVAVLRELLQNSDDAKATKQIFLLDRRSHASPLIQYYSPWLASCQGPALLAINDTIFEQKDWDAISSIHQSSKRADELTTGKFGLGFQACYHVTDNPQIYSDGLLVILDPHRRMSDNGGILLNTGPALDPFLSVLGPRDPHETTIIRLPIRTQFLAELSEIKQDPLSPDNIKEWFNKFITTELKVGLLFLKHITSIELQEVGDDGVFRPIAIVRIRDADEHIRAIRSRFKGRADGQESYHLTIEMFNGNEIPEETTWMVTQFVDNYAKAEKQMSERLGYPAGGKMRKDKLLPHVGLAIPLSADGIIQCQGKLFTLLPLPIATKFPLHIHSVFALMSDRQRLRNPQERGDAGSREQLLIEWNRYLFSSVVPQAWARLLQDLAGLGGDLDIYSAWPVQSGGSGIGDEEYWQELRSNLLRNAASRPVWPVMGGGYVTLDKVMIWDKTKDEKNFIEALMEAKVPISAAPRHIIHLMGSTPGMYRTRVLVPMTAAIFLEKRITELRALDKLQRMAVMEYLAAGQEISLYTGLPLFRNVAGSIVALNLTTPQLLASKDEVTLFGTKDGTMLGIEDLPPDTKLVLLKSKRFLRITPPHIIKLLQEPPNSDISAPASPETIEWIFQFWKYLATRTQVSQLVRDLKGCYLLPDQRGILHKVSDQILGSSGTKDQLGPALEKFGVPFLHPSANDEAKQTLNRHQVIASINDVAFLVDRITKASVPEVSDATSQSFLHNHLETFVANFKLTKAQRTSLRNIPIFPVLPPGPRDPSRDPAFGVAKAPCTFVDSNVLVIPYVEGEQFLDASQSRNLVAALHIGQVFNEIDVLKMVLEENMWWSQPEDTREALLDRIINRFSDLYNNAQAREKILTLPLFDVGGGKRRIPSEVVDNKAKIAVLFDENEQVLPVNPNEKLLQRLREADMVKHQLTREIIEERMRKRDKDRSFMLLKLVDDQIRRSDNKKAPLSDLIPSQFATSPWLYASDGFHAPIECRDRPSEKEVLLYDLVVPVVEYKVRSEALRKELKWGPVDLLMLKAQLEKALKVSIEESSARVEAVISELARGLASGRFTGKDLGDLRTFLADRPWVPVEGEFKAARYCVFEETNLGSLCGFARVPFELRKTNQLKKLLVDFGVLSRPSKAALLESIAHLELKATFDNTELVIKSAIDLLSEISNLDLHPDERRRIRLPVQSPPGKILQFASIDEVCYNDSDREEIVKDTRLAHPSISRDLAEKLELERWSDREFGDVDDGVFGSFDVKEELTTRIKNLLDRGYTIDSSCNEWVANAMDAGARHVSFYLNDFLLPVKLAPTPLLGDLFGGPSLIVHNNSIFSESDFEGLRSVGLGGKAGDYKTIGRFGLGVLSFYHFGDVIMVISGDSVVFMDPSKDYLPRKRVGSSRARRAGLRMSLKDCWGRYRDLFTSLKGIEGFEPSNGNFNGTIFVIPLRPTSPPNPSKLSSTPCLVSDIKDFIFPTFLDHVQKSFFFSQMEEIKASCRKSCEDSHLLWAVRAQRKLEEDGTNGFISQKIKLTVTDAAREVVTDWLSISHQRHIPDGRGYDTLILRHRLPNPITVSLAMQITRNPVPFNHHMFATLPLPIQTDLPFHLDGRWVLSDDRRHLHLGSRKEQHPGLETSFNHWLLSVAPVLFLHAIAVAGREKDTRMLVQTLWPKLSVSLPADRIVVQGIYEEFGNSDEAVCHVSSEVTHGDVMKKPREVVFGKNGNESVRALLLQFLPNFVILPSSFETSAVEWRYLATDTSELVRSTISAHASTMALDSNFLKNFGIRLDEIVSYLIRGNQSLINLPLLQMHNGTLSNFAASDQPPVFAFSQELISLFGEKRVMARRSLSEETIDAILKTEKVNLQRIDTKGVRLLLQDGPFQIVPDDSMTPNNFAAAKEWLDDFWSDSSRLRRLGINMDLRSLYDLPLLPTMDGLLISPRSCQTKYPFLKPIRNNDSTTIVTILSTLGATVIDLPRHSSIALLDVASTVEIERVLSVLSYLCTWVSSASMASSMQWPVLVQWIKQNIRARMIPVLLQQYPMLVNLPLWESRQPRQTSSAVFKGLGEVTMLPQGISLADVELYLRAEVADWYTAYAYELDAIIATSPHWQWHRLSSSEILTLIRWPEVITGGEIAQYHKLLLSMRFSDPDILRQTAIFPDGHLQLRKASSLYDDQFPLYRIAFRHQPYRFIHPEFRDLLPLLAPLGLVSTTTADGFITAVRTIDAAVREGLTFPPEINQIVFSTLNRTPWMFKEGTRDRIWDELRRLRFVRRSYARGYHPGFKGMDKQLDDIVSLDQLLLDDLYPVAWTQRTFFAEEPTEDLRAVFARIGRPSAEEVVDHLSALVAAAQENPSTFEEIQNDLEETYNWLNEHSKEAKQYLLRRSRESLFLNQDTLDTDTYAWHSAQNMWLNLAWDDKDKSIYYVKKFLEPYSDLLKAAGVQSYPDPEPLPIVLEATYFKMHARLARLRDEGKWTDVELISRDEARLRAHRPVLAAASSYFDNILTDRSNESTTEHTSENPVILYELGYSADELNQALDYIYQGTFEPPSYRIPTEPSVVLTPLLNLLSLSNTWCLQGLKRHAQKAIIDLKLITPSTIDSIMSRCRDTGADELLDRCIKVQKVVGKK